MRLTVGVNIKLLEWQTDFDVNFVRASFKIKQKDLALCSSNMALGLGIYSCFVAANFVATPNYQKHRLIVSVSAYFFGEIVRFEHLLNLFAHFQR